MMNFKLPSLALALAGLLTTIGLAGSASADSPLTSTRVVSKTAAAIGPAPYRGADVSLARANRVVSSGLAAIKSSHASPTVGLAVLQRVDSATMDHPEAAAAFKQGLTNLARHTSDPTTKTNIGLLRGTMTILRDPSDAYAAREVNKAAAAQPHDARVQLVAGLASAQRASFGSGNASGATQLWKQAATRLEAAEGPGHTSHITKTAGASAQAYLSLYEGFNKAEAQVATKPSR